MSDTPAGECLFAQYVDAYCDGELPAALEEEMHRHVFGCASCAAAVRQTVEISDSIAAIQTRRLPESVRSGIHTRAASSWDGGTMRLLRYMSGIAAVILVGASVWVARMGSVAPVTSAPGVNSSDAHVAEWIVKDLSAHRAAAATEQSGDSSARDSSAPAPERP